MPELKTRAAWRVGLLGALGLVAASCATALEDTVLTESFKGTEPLANWVLSKSTKYAGQPITVKVTNITGYPGEQTLLLEKANHHYGIATPFKVAVDNTDKPFVVQYEVKMDEILTCGGAYIKLFEESAAAKLEEFDNNTPYIIMFGPDKCGGTNKVHFILRHKNPVTGEWQEKHAKGVPPVKIDRKSNLYTLIVRPDNSFEILVNNVREKKGSLLEDMDPPVNPPEYIDDPSDKKPEDWVDEAKIADPEARKPDDWDEDAPLTIPDMDAVKPAGWLDDEPELVADPEATEPEDWEEEEDGVWEAPLISNPKCEEAPGCGEWVRPTKANPAYKGKWSAPLIDNPEYKGEWKPRQIRNPGFFTDDHPHNLPKMGALAVEIWTTNAGLRFDNFYVGYSEEAAAQFAEETWKPKYEAEKAAEDAAKKEAKNKERTTKKLEGGWRNLAEVYAQDAMEYFVEKPIAAVATAVALILSFVLLLWRPKRATEPAASAKSTDDEPNTQGAEDSGVEEKKSSAPGKGEDDEDEEEEEEEEEDDKADDDN